MRHQTIVFRITQDFPGRDWPIGADIVLNQYDSFSGQMLGEKKGRIWWEKQLRKYPNIYQQVPDEELVTRKLLNLIKNDSRNNTSTRKD